MLRRGWTRYWRKNRPDMVVSLVPHYNRTFLGLQPGLPTGLAGFTTSVPQYMALADFFIGKAGPGSVSEALATRLPVIEEREFGIVLPSFSRIASGVREMIEPGRYSRFRRNVEGIRNSAVFEIPALLSDILAAV
jgi:1,2-diacylglycerol 3-beta-galactosyltransferase